MREAPVKSEVEIITSPRTGAFENRVPVLSTFIGDTITTTAPSPCYHGQRGSITARQLAEHEAI
jgi:hypothetical protein